MRGSTAFAALWLLCSVLFAEENASVAIGHQSLEHYLSDLKRQTFDLEYEKSEQESIKLRDSWISPVALKYTFYRQNPYNGQGAPETQTETASIAIDQPIFRSGGIFYAIRYAEAVRDVGRYSIEQQERQLIKQAVSLLMQIKQAELSIRKQTLLIDNARINLEQKREQYLGGQLDSGFLNSAIIELNGVKLVLLDLQTAKERLISSFKSISDLDYRRAPVPILAMIDEGDFLSDAIDVKLNRSTVEKERWFTRGTVAQYLPSINLQASYNWQKQESFFFVGSGAVKSQPPETAFHRYGLTASMPLDFNSLNDYEAAQAAYLQARVQVGDTKRALKALHEQVMQNLRNIDAKIALSVENAALYATLRNDTESLFHAGLKTAYDVKTLENSEAIEAINQRLYRIDRQLELLNLYEKLSGEVGS